MKLDQYLICANCKHFASADRYHGTCSEKREIRQVGGVCIEDDLRTRWNDDARNCDLFEPEM